MDLGHHRVGAAEGQKREDGELHEQRCQGVREWLHVARLQTMATLIGARTNSTHGKGRRKTPTATKAARMNGAASRGRRFRSGSANFAGVATTRPAAAAPTPP